jgi:hypothetical protein
MWKMWLRGIPQEEQLILLIWAVSLLESAWLILGVCFIPWRALLCNPALFPQNGFVSTVCYLNFSFSARSVGSCSRSTAWERQLIDDVEV